MAFNADEYVDVIVELGSWADYVHLQERLRERGFQEDRSEGAPLCRWVTQGIKIDVMPTREEILGFTNRWCTAAMQDATMPFHNTVFICAGLNG